MYSTTAAPWVSHCKITACLLVSGILAQAAAATSNTRSFSDEISEIRESFCSPPMEYGPHAFWFWNAEVNADLSAYMAREMSAKGMNPGYIHPRHAGHSEGLPVNQWLSREYFDAFSEVLDECESAGTYLGFCDEYWWPSGRIGGYMVQKHPKLQARELTWQVTAKKGPWNLILPPNQFIVACQESSPGILDSETLQLIATGEQKEWKVPDGHWNLFVFNVVPTATRNRGPDQVLVNYMEPDLVDRTIEMGLKPYEAYLKKHMGKSLRYCFSDNEGEYGGRLPWSDHLIELYDEMFGEDIRLALPLLLAEDGQGTWPVARHRWFSMISHHYANNFWKPINDWLEKRGIFYVCNFWEANLMLQAATVGDFFEVNRAFSLPGNDALMMNATNVRHFKEVQSVCEFEQRPFMSEVMGVQGWGQTPAQMKITANAATAYGVTQMVPHGVNLERNMEAVLHPADWFEDNPYWETITEWNDFCRRAAFINSQGKLAARTLLYCPMTSIYPLSRNYLSGRAARGAWDNSLASDINGTYLRLQTELTALHIEFLIADDHYIEKGIVSSQEDELKILHHQFSSIILPPLFSMDAAIYEKIVVAAEAGVRVFITGTLPVASTAVGLDDPGISSLNQRLLASGSVTDLSSLPRAESAEAIAWAIRQETGSTLEQDGGLVPLYTTRRFIDGKHFYWIANVQADQAHLSARFPDASGRASKWNCETGRIEPIPSKDTADGSRIDLLIEPLEAFWLAFDPGRPALAELDTPKSDERSLGDGLWDVQVVNRVVPVSTGQIAVGEILEANAFSATQSILAPLEIEGRWNAQWMQSRAILKAYTIYDHDWDELPLEAILSITTTYAFELFINGKQVKEITNAREWRVPDAVDILPYLKKGKNRFAIRSPGFLEGGTHNILVQGEEVLADGTRNGFIGAKTPWRYSTETEEDVRKMSVSYASAQPVSKRPWDRLHWSGLADVHNPVSRIIDPDETVWLRIPIPPAAHTFSAPFRPEGISATVDGDPVRVSGHEIPIPGNARNLMLSGRRSQFDKWTEPAEFRCEGSVGLPLDHWTDWGMDRYSGFVSYAKTFDLTDSDTATTLTLDLGEVRFVAQVWLNGKHVGSRMWYPFTFDLTGYAQPGQNNLEIRIGNLIANRLAASDDMGKLHTWGNFGKPPQELFEAGLFGPVTLILTSSPTDEGHLGQLSTAYSPTED